MPATSPPTTTFEVLMAMFSPAEGAEAPPSYASPPAAQLLSVRPARRHARRDRFRQKLERSIQRPSARARAGKMPHAHHDEVARWDHICVLATGTAKRERITRQLPDTARVH